MTNQCEPVARVVPEEELSNWGMIYRLPVLKAECDARKLYDFASQTYECLCMDGIFVAYMYSIG